MNVPQIYYDEIGVESYFMRIVDPVEDCGVWLKFTFLKTEHTIMFKVWSTYFDRLSKPSTSSIVFPIDQVEARSDAIYWPGGYIKFEGGSAGRTKEHSWDFSWKAIDDRPIKLLPDFLYSNKIPTTKLITPYPRLSVVGEFRTPVILFMHRHGELNGMQGHNWGPKHSREYVWSFGSSPMFVFEGFSTSIFPLKFTSFCIRHGEKDYLFSDVLRPFRIGSTYNPEHFSWRIRSSRLGGSARVSCIGHPHRDATLEYKNPDGSSMNCHNDNMSSIYISLKTNGCISGDSVVGALEFLKK